MVYRLGADETRHAAWPLRLGPAGTDRGRAAVTQGRSGGHDQDIDRRGDQLCASCRAATPWGGGVGPWSRAQIGTGRCSPW